MKVLMAVALIVLFAASTIVKIVLAQDATAPATTPEFLSLFEGDTCESPCWFGLRPDESTSEDVYEFLSRNSSRFWNYLIEEGRTSDNLPIVAATLNLQALKEGKTIDFFWQGSSYGGNVSIGSSISFTNNLVSAMDIQPDVSISLNTALRLLGEPDAIRAGISFYYDFMLFYYPEPQMIVELTINRDSDCKIANVLQQFQVDYVSYLARPVYLERLIDMLNGSDYVPNKLWESWVGGEVNETCENAIGSLWR
ncbi:MAG: hypothetical protein ABI700_24200 [Chloroflexota bacterium]